MRTAAVAGLTGLALLAGPLAASPIAAGPAVRQGATGSAPPVVVRYQRPVPGAVLRPFEQPPTPYAAGHRGVDLAAAGGSTVRAAGPGTVRFAGSVAGRGVVVIAHPDGLSTEYEPVRPLVRAGRAVAAGDVIARVAGRHAGCRASCLHWGARRGAVYLDPLGLLGALGPVALLPWPREG